MSDFVGTDPMYQTRPVVTGSPKSDLYEAAQDFEEERNKGVGFSGFSDVPEVPEDPEEQQSGQGGPEAPI